MFGFGIPELIVIGIILLVVFGPGKLPQIGSALGSAIRNFKKAAEGEPKELKDGEQEKKPQPPGGGGTA